MKKLKITLTKNNSVKIESKKNQLTVSGIENLERLGHQCLDAAIVLKDKSL